MAPSGRDLTLIHSRLHIANSRGLTTGCPSLCVFFCFGSFLSSSIRPLLSLSLGRFDIITAVTQSKPVKVKLPPSLPCLTVLAWFLLCPCCFGNLVRRIGWEYITTKSLSVALWGRDMCTVHVCDILPDKSRHRVHVSNLNNNLSFSCGQLALYLSVTTECLTASAEQHSGRQNWSLWLWKAGADETDQVWLQPQL